MPNSLVLKASQCIVRYRSKIQIGRFVCIDWEREYWVSHLLTSQLASDIRSVSREEANSAYKYLPLTTYMQCIKTHPMDAIIEGCSTTIPTVIPYRKSIPIALFIIANRFKRIYADIRELDATTPKNMIISIGAMYTRRGGLGISTPSREPLAR